MSVLSTTHTIKLQIFNDWQIDRWELQHVANHEDIYSLAQWAPKRLLVESHWEAYLEVTLGQPESLDRLLELHRNQGGTCSRHIGPATVCQSCGTAWLPGTLVCPNCAGSIDYQPQAIEYQGRQGYVLSVREYSRLPSVVSAEVGLWLSEEAVTLTGPRTFALSIDDKPGSWLCGYCGLYVSGYTSKCPGCGGNRLTIKQLHGLQRECIYCGRQVVGAGYACPRCNQRLARSWRREPVF